VPIAGKAHCWLFAAGLFILLAALALWAHVSSPATVRGEQSALYGQVWGVVRQWQSCPTCHAAQEDAPALRRVFPALVHQPIEPIEWPAASPNRRGNTPAAAFDRQVVEVGQRLLELLPSGDPQVEQAAKDYLAITAALDGHTDAVARMTALQRLAQLEGVLRDLRAASGATVFWTTSSPAHATVASPVALFSSPLPLMALLVLGVLVLVEQRLLARKPGSRSEAALSLVTRAISRRGPPATALVAFLDSAPKKIAAPWACNLLFVHRVGWVIWR
jgi:hypothetical protein